MKITHIETYPVRVPPVEPPFRWRAGLPGSAEYGPAEGVVLRIGTDEGAEGAAFFSRMSAVAMVESLVEHVYRPEYLGKDPLMREWHYDRMWELDRLHEFPLPVFGLFDVALWDLAGRAAGLPAYKLMGGMRESLPAYASTVTFGTTEEFLDVASQCIELGYPAIKLHAWGDAKRDAALCLALREHVGDEMDLMYDGSAGFDLPDAIYLGRALSDANYRWYEEPMREFSVSAYRELARAVDVPLLSAETSDGAYMNSADFIAAGAATFGVRTSAGLRGGMTGAMRTAHLADAFRIRAEVHGGGIHAEHLCMAISNTTYYESLVHCSTVTREAVVDENGLLHAPTEPGIALPPGLDYPEAVRHFARVA
ncbi:enolase C-terminal domain-like protein [Microbacterium sp. ASV49]|uniref:Enolase C-terminal domain-like protein n=1 Tax=Microbacterium candidum TaxID=3041922 RepID=A0ABT7MTL8_9MICO|nr:enolase C-terminal domain-like protein [Microbacterium sp. ASV49]MDL9977795.1 enolase C-terminal domain-like protein [Microbacterium sp. ASV49]